MNKYITLLVLVALGISSCKTSKKVNIKDTLSATSTLIYENNFDKGLVDWKVEQMAGGTVEAINDKLEINDVSGCTIWLQKEFSGPIMITYDAFVIDEGGPNDRVSDLNCFWMAKDLEHPNDLFANSDNRGGKFSNYDSLRLYYMGVGGHDNSKTRFRRYTGNGERPLLDMYDYSESKYLIKANEVNKIKIIAYNNTIQYYRNDVLIVDFYDDNPYVTGYFGFRTVKNHMTVDNFKVYQLSTK